MDNSAVCIMLCSIMIGESKFPSQTVPLAFGDVFGLLGVMSEVRKTLWEYVHGERAIKAVGDP